MTSMRRRVDIRRTSQRAWRPEDLDVVLAGEGGKGLEVRRQFVRRRDGGGRGPATCLQHEVVEPGGCMDGEVSHLRTGHGYGCWNARSAYLCSNGPADGCA